MHLPQILASDTESRAENVRKPRKSRAENVRKLHCVILEGSRIFEEFKGALTEQYVCQELQCIEGLQSNFYWTSQSKAEIDFLLSDGLDVIPLECKSGYTMNAKSLKTYREKYAPNKALRTSLLPYERNENGLTNIPLYMLFAIDDEIRG